MVMEVVVREEDKMIVKKEDMKLLTRDTMAVGHIMKDEIASMTTDPLLIFVLKA